MTESEVLYCILGMCVVSYIPRLLPPFVLARYSLPPVVAAWLKCVPTSVFGALVFSEVFINGDGVNLRLDNINLIVSLLVLAVAVRTKSLGKSIVTGVGFFWMIKYVV